MNDKIISKYELFEYAHNYSAHSINIECSMADLNRLTIQDRGKSAKSMHSIMLFLRLKKEN
jgi:hypothetical protein